MFATVVLVVETGTIASYAAVAADPSATGAKLRALGSTLVHSVGGSVVLLVVLVLNVYKPPGLTPYGCAGSAKSAGRTAASIPRR